MVPAFELPSELAKGTAMCTSRIAVLYLLFLLALPGVADDSNAEKVEPKYPSGATPRIVFVARVSDDGNQVIYRDYFNEAPNPTIAGPTKYSGMIATRPIGEGRGAAVFVAFPLALGEVYDMKGKKVTDRRGQEKLALGTVALVSRDGATKLDPAFLKAMREDTLLLIFPKPTQK